METSAMVDPNRAKSIFLAASEKPRDDRASFLNEVVNGDSELRARVEALLNAHEDPDSFLDNAAVPLATVDHVAAAPLAECPGTLIGRYKLLEQIGEGGMGVVYMAEQQKPVRRRVALKIIKVGMDTKQVVARFEAERQALALMDHSNIARVFDAGATDSGRPYFVMELVRGIPITEFCDQNNVPVRERLELFVQVCHAVQHAHQKGIIHRDIKPSNVLVTRHDDQPVVKVIDFGIAKATQSRLTEKTLFTEFHQLIGTPTYMSPEQAGMSDLDVDTRSDIYSLGVLLYELLTGSTPFDIKSLVNAGYAEIQRVIREVEPPRPSTRLSTMGSTLPSVAMLRHTDPNQLTKLVRGDLDWIVMKALEKDRLRRYDTAGSLSEDVERHLSGEAVLAAPPTVRYRARKFILRNKGAVFAGTLVASTLLLGIVGFAWQAHRASVERDLAVASGEAQKAERRKSDLINQFLQRSLQSADPGQGGNQDMKVSVLMLKAVKDLDAGIFKDQPDVDAGLRLTIADILYSNGHAGDALPLAQKALEIYRQTNSGDSPEVARSLDTVALTLHDVEPDAAARELLIWQEALASHGREIVRSLNIGDLALHDVEHDTAILEVLIGQEALAMRRRLYPTGHRDVAKSLTDVATTLRSMSLSEQAEPLLREALEMDRRISHGDDRDVARDLDNMALALVELQRPKEALSYEQEALDMRRRFFTGDHPDVAQSLSSLVLVKRTLGHADEALASAREALAVRQQCFPGDHILVAKAMDNLSSVLSDLDRFQEAEAGFRNAVAMYNRIYPGDHPRKAVLMSDLAECLGKLGQRSEALDLAQQASEMAARTIPPKDHRIRKRCDQVLADLNSQTMIDADTSKKSAAQQ
jgi:eukaryotic-like serine/threonine-protein kinase